MALKAKLLTDSFRQTIHGEAGAQRDQLLALADKHELETNKRFDAELTANMAAVMTLESQAPSAGMR